MKVSVTTVLLDIEGIPLRDSKVVDSAGKVLRPERDFTLRKACIDALNAQGLSGDSPDGEEKYKRFLLAHKIMNNDSPDLSVEDLTLLKRLIGLAFPGIVVGRAYQLLDPTPSKDSP